MTQSEAFQTMLSGANVFLSGPPGSGKSYVLEKFIEQAKLKGQEVAITATTGIAASLIGGITIHSWAGLFNHFKEPEILPKREIFDRIKRTDILIIDEVSMLSSERLSRLDYVLQSVRASRQALGGIQVILSGDFFQLPPIARSSESAYAFKAQTWRDLNLQVCYLSEQHRQAGNDGLSMLLGAMRSSSLNAQHLGLLLDRRVKPGRDITALLTHNADVDKLNHERLDKLRGNTYVYEMTATGPRDMVNELKRSVIAPEKLHLKVGAKVMFTANNLALGYANGTIGTVCRFSHGMPVIELKDKNLHIKVEPRQWTNLQPENLNASVYQLPIRLAWAVTIHKCQGMSLDEAEIDLSRSFTYGMGYVALSRLRDLGGLYLRGLNSRSLEMDPEVKKFDSEIRQSSALIQSASKNGSEIRHEELAALLYANGASKKFIQLSTGLTASDLKKILK